MHLLVSVANATEAVSALDGGADLIDAKNPTAGALGAVTLDVLRAICGAVGDARPVTAALGDAADQRTVARDAHAFATAGAALVKVGFAGVTDPDRAATLGAAAVRAASLGGAGVVLVAYADAARVGSLDPRALVAVATAAGARGVL
ncbi:MAG TPA: (5-formylfuran-3-yl)methyl phosphate synthase, partial [Gemmatirosa sp.]